MSMFNFSFAIHGIIMLIMFILFLVVFIMALIRIVKGQQRQDKISAIVDEQIINSNTEFKELRCPNCHAKIKDANMTECEYCGSTLVKIKKNSN